MWPVGRFRITLAATLLAAVGLSACASHADRDSERSTVPDAQVKTPSATSSIAAVAGGNGARPSADWSSRSADLLAKIDGCDLQPSFTEDAFGNPYAGCYLGDSKIVAGYVRDNQREIDDLMHKLDLNLVPTGAVIGKYFLILVGTDDSSKPTAADYAAIAHQVGGKAIQTSGS